MLSSLPLLALAVSSVQAIGIIDNLTNKVKVVAQAVTFDAGDYVIKNAETGDYLSFRRPGDTTNLHTSSEYGIVTLTHGGAKGMSGVNFGQYSGTIIAGGNSKCGSAQWGMEGGLGIDVALVAYACTVGDNDVGTDTLEVAKQFWRFVPCGDSSSSSDSSSSDRVANSSAEVKLNAEVKAPSNDASTASFSSANSQATPTATADDGSDDSGSGYDLDAGFTPKSTQAVVKSDQSTWTCQHSGKWLARHPDYITKAGHIECADDLAAYQASLRKRSSPPSHKAMAKRLRKRAANNGRYCIIAEDHLTDMTTRAVGSKNVDSFGGYTSQVLVNWDASDKSQQWDVYAA